MNYKNIAFIPLRGGSKSIPFKNIKEIGGRPLAYWVLDATTNCSYIDKVFVCTDSDEIKETVKKYGSDKIIIVGRSKETAQDNSSTESAMLEFASQYEFENIVLVQATSPLLESNDLNNGFDMLVKDNYDSILSAVKQKRFLWEAQNDGSYNSKNYDYKNRPRRQDFEGYLVENGAFYMTSKERLMDSKCRISGRIGIVEMKEESYFEIDEPSDWFIVDKLLKKKNKSNHVINDVICRVKLLITDCDGVLTDGGMYYAEDGIELKKFNTKDGKGIELLRKEGISTVIVTGEKCESVKNRARKLNVSIYTGIKDKGSLIKEIAKKNNVDLSDIAYIGDDINDLEAIKIVGFGCSVSNGIKEVKEASRFVTEAKGGEGALREVAELILRTKR